ncbi:MAG: 4-hydroxyphenyl-beta-ketoacyl-CoA hydrolase, partial [SAR202 cluster bacterium]|nr:4-hydroxyphenyl-beta-ketoacyl-CoA hydrolase [SAR202 cluster bacterium]
MHAPREPGLPEPKIDESLRRHFRLKDEPPDVDGMAALYEKWDIFGVVFSIDDEMTSGEKPDSNGYVASIVKRYPRQFVGFASVDPWRENAVAEVERSVKTLGLSGLKLHPVQQAFYPNDERLYPIYETCSSLGAPVLFHSGFAASGLGMPGGGG